jgi:DnaJ-class molecular chaperone
MQDYYKVLGVGRNASEQEIKQAYRRLARTYHPDVNPGNKAAETRFKEINEAYEVLSDKEKRQKYDQFGRDWQRYAQAGGAGSGAYRGGPGAYRSSPFGGAGGAGGAGGFDASNFADIFEAFFGGGAAGASAGTGRGGPWNGGFESDVQQGLDVEQTVEITLEEAFTGTERSMRLNDTSRAVRSIKARIPPGADTGTRVRFAGEGRAGPGGQRGDLTLLVRVLDHSRFTRKGTTLSLHVPVDLYSLLLGGSVRVTTIDGKKLTLSIPPNTANGEVFRLSGQGMPSLKQSDRRGDLYVTVDAQLPTPLSPKERELFEQLRKLRR